MAHQLVALPGEVDGWEPPFEKKTGPNKRNI